TSRSISSEGRPPGSHSDACQLTAGAGLWSPEKCSSRRPRALNRPIICPKGVRQITPSMASESERRAFCGLRLFMRVLPAGKGKSLQTGVDGALGGQPAAEQHQLRRVEGADEEVLMTFDDVAGGGRTLEALVAREGQMRA